MPRKRIPIFQKVSRNLVKVSIFVSKMRRPMVPKLKRYYCKKETITNNYRFLREYEFSPTSSPLVKFNTTRRFNNRRKKEKEKEEREIRLLVFLSSCFCGLKGGGEVREWDCQFSIETIPNPTHIEERYLEPLDLEDEEGESVDERAEVFINRFYQEMRRQRLQNYC